METSPPSIYSKENLQASAKQALCWTLAIAVLEKSERLTWQFSPKALGKFQ